MQKLIDIIILDYFKMFGFILGIRNEYFNYYNNLEDYNIFYFTEKTFIYVDFTLLKYLFAMNDNKLNMDYLLKISNIENVYPFFCRVFKQENLKNNINEKEKEGQGKIDIDNTFNNLLDNNKSDNEKNKDEDQNKHVLQWVRIFELIIIIMKNDYAHFFGIL